MVLTNTVMDKVHREKKSDKVEISSLCVEDKSSFETQVGGDHYQKYAIQPTEFFERNRFSYMQASAMKYLVRFKDKGKPIEDLQKAKHYIDMLIELYSED
jgi:hypothetical protein